MPKKILKNDSNIISLFTKEEQGIMLSRIKNMLVKIFDLRIEYV